MGLRQFQAFESFFFFVACRYLPSRKESIQQQKKVLPTASGSQVNTLPRLASQLVRLPSIPETPPPVTHNIKILTDYLSDVISHRDYEGLVAAGVEGNSIPRLDIPRLGDGKTHIMLQVCIRTGFRYW